MDIDPPPETLDVLVVGAGISGVDAAYRIQTMCPGLSYAVLEARSSMGGTWDLFRYPGIRSDSDMYTLGFPFEPWTGERSISDGASILAYVKDTAAAHGIDRHIRYGHRVLGASWSSGEARWTVDVETPDGPRRFVASWLHTATGYYRYDRGYTPDLPGLDDYTGTLVHPQLWPQELDVNGKHVVVIGSGATAITLVPALVDRGATVTMLQRSPSYVVALPSRDRTAPLLHRGLGPRRAHQVLRWKNLMTGLALYQASRRAPRTMSRLVTAGATRATGLPPEHFTPPYDPWDQRMCFAPDGDLFTAVRSGRADLVTDAVDRVLPEGVRTVGGRVLPADVLVTATGLSLLALGGASLTVDGAPVDVPDRYLYRGLMIQGVPNLTLSIGYTNASWTLRADLAARHACRLISRLRSTGAHYAYPVPHRTMTSRPALPLTSGYVQRSIRELPKQGDRRPWVVPQNYLRDRRDLRGADLMQDLVVDRPPLPA